MIKVSLIALGRLKEPYLRDAAYEYEKRLSRYCSLSVCELPAVKLSDNLNDNLIQSALLREAAAIKKHIPKDSFNIALCIEGKRLTSEQFAVLIKEKSDAGIPVCFTVGSSYGLHKTVKKQADLRLSVSDMTFPHQLFRIMLLEQIYRAFKINWGGAYHK